MGMTFMLAVSILLEFHWMFISKTTSLNNYIIIININNSIINNNSTSIIIINNSTSTSISINISISTSTSIIFSTSTSDNSFISLINMLVFLKFRRLGSPREE